MALSHIVDYDSIRAVLGVSEAEVENTALDTLIYEVRLTEEFRSTGATLYADFIAAKVLASPTAASTRFVQVTQLFAAYFTANCLLAALPLFAPKHITDGKGGQDRVTDPYKGLRDTLPQDLAYVKSRLLDAYAAYQPTADIEVAVTRVLVAGVPLAISPITG